MPISFDDWLQALRRHTLLSVVTFVAVLSVTVYIILFSPRAYTSEARLMLRIGRESVALDPTATTVGETLDLQNTRENEIQSALGVMRSREIIERVVDELGEEMILSGKPVIEHESSSSDSAGLVSNLIGSAKGLFSQIDPVPNRQRAIRKLAQGVSLNSRDESSVVSVAYTTDSPEVAQHVVSKWVDHYIIQHAKVNHTEGSLQFFEDQGDLLLERLDVVRANLESAKSKSNLVTIDGQQKLVEAQLAKVRDSLVNVDAEIESVQSRIVTYDELLAQNPEMITTTITGKTNEARDLMRDRLFELEVQQKDLESKFNPDHPKLISIRNQIEDTKRIVADQAASRDEITAAINPAHQQLREKKLIDQAELAGLLQKQQSLTASRDRIRQEIAKLNSTERSIKSIENELVILEDRYSESAIKMEQARLEDVLAKERITSVNVAQPATLELRPVSPNKPFCAVAGLFGAFTLAMGLPILLEIRHGRSLQRRRIDSLDDWGFEQREENHVGDEPIGRDHLPNPSSEESLQPMGSP